MSGSEDGEILFWDFRSKEIAQRVSGHEGVVCWVDAAPGPGGMVASGGMDGTVRMWVNVDEDNQGVRGINGLKLEHEGGLVDEGDDMDMVKEEDGAAFDDTHMDGTVVAGSPERDLGHSPNGHRSPDRMDED